MPFEERTQPMEQTGHRIILVSRERLTVSGVSGVESFDENAIVMATEDGRLHIRGEELHIEKLSLDGGDLLVRGRVDALTYEEEEEPREGLLRRLLRG
ncbi:MAG: YabP/YqfC family sporulation protein [Clostridiales bacterium]|nr:YabP/YqfC family sporulation protein [Clostridiales bacterium]